VDIVFGGGSGSCGTKPWLEASKRITEEGSWEEGEGVGRAGGGSGDGGEGKRGGCKSGGGG